MMQQPKMDSRIGMNQGHYIQGYNSMHHMVGGAYPQNYIMVAGQPPPPPHETMLTATQPQMQIVRPPSQQVLLMQQLLHQQQQLQAQQHLQTNVSPIPGQQQLCSALTPPLFVGGAQQQQLPASFGSGVSIGFGGLSQQQQTQQALALQQQYMAQAPSAGGSSTTAQPLGQQQQQTSRASVGSSGQAQMTDPIPSPIRVVKPGSIKEPDRLFNQLAKDTGDKYKGVGIELGLTFQNQQNALETGPYAMLPADQRALKMLNLWRDKSPEKDFTYAILATALEKNELQRFADQYCYMDHSGSQ